VGAGNYTKDLEESLGLQNALATVNTALLDTEGRCEAFKEQFVKYSFLWKTDMQQALQVKHHGVMLEIGMVALNIPWFSQTLVVAAKLLLLHAMKAGS